MKKARKLLVALLVLTFMMSTFSVGFAQEADEKLPSEVVRAQALGILKGDDQGNLNLDQPITRAEALALVVRILGLEKSADLMAGQTQFADANAAPNLQWATGYINLGVGQGIINGYPDGTFKGSDQVTYAEMAKMILYAMNYGVTVEGGIWPAAVMGKADDLGIFDDVNALPNVPALRGDVVMMIDNSLTINHLVQTGYGDLTQYEEGDASFLSKMDVDELEDVRVTEIARVNDKLDDDEIELTEYDKDGKVVDSDIYTLIADVSAEEIFGLEVDAWVNDDDEVFFVKVTTSEKDILFDTVDYEESDDEEITLKDADKTYKWADGAVAYVNFEEVDFEDIDENAYGKVVLDRGRVAFANLFEFENVGVVTKIDDKVIEFVAHNTDEDEIDLEDYDDVYIYNPDFSKADVDDIDVDSAIFFWEGDDDDIYIIVKNEVVEGEVERVKEDKIKVDGKEYSQGSYAIITLDKGDNYDTWQTKNIELVEDFVDEEAMLVLDLRGRVLLVTGAAKSTSGNMYGIVTYARDTRNATLTVFTTEDKEVDYKAESRTEHRDLAKLDFTTQYAVLKYKLNADGEIAEEKATSVEIKNKALGVKAGPDTEKIYPGQLHKEADKKVVKIGSDNFYITKDTVVMKALKSKNTGYEIDPEIIKTDKLISIGFSASAATNAVIFVGKGSDADFIVFLDEDFTGAEEDLFYGVVTDGPWKSGKNFYAEINVFGEGIKEYKVSDEDVFKNGKVVAFDLNNKDEAVYRGSLEDKNINNYKDGYLTTDAAKYKVDSSAVIYNLKSSGKVDKKIALSKLNDYKSIKFMLDENNILVAATVSAKVTDAPPTPPETEGTVTYINGGAALTKTLVLDAAPSATNKVSVMYNNTTNKDILVKSGSVSVRLVNTDNGTIVAAATITEGADRFLPANISTNLGDVELQGNVVAGTNYEIRAYLDGVQLDGVAKIYVKDAVNTVKSVTVDGETLTAVTSANTYTFTLALGKKAENITVKESDIKLTSTKAKIVDFTKVDDETYTFNVEAENGDKIATDQTIKLVETTIDASSSSVSVAAAADADGNTLVTVIVKDTNGDPVKGLAEAVFTVKAGALGSEVEVDIVDFVALVGSSAGTYELTVEGDITGAASVLVDVDGVEF